MRKPMLAIAAAIVASLAAPPKPAQAGCWGWCVVPGTSHAFVYGSITRRRMDWRSGTLPGPMPPGTI